MKSIQVTYRNAKPGMIAKAKAKLRITLSKLPPAGRPSHPVQFKVARRGEILTVSFYDGPHELIKGAIMGIMLTLGIDVWGAHVDMGEPLPY